MALYVFSCYNMTCCSLGIIFSVPSTSSDQCHIVCLFPSCAMLWLICILKAHCSCFWKVNPSCHRTSKRKGLCRTWIESTPRSLLCKGKIHSRILWPSQGPKRTRNLTLWVALILSPLLSLSNETMIWSLSTPKCRRLDATGSHFLVKCLRVIIKNNKAQRAWGSFVLHRFFADLQIHEPQYQCL